MKLYLSSNGLGNHADVLVNLVGLNKAVGIILNAADTGKADTHSAYAAQEIDNMQSIGLAAEVLDLRDYFGRRDQLRRRLENYGLIWVAGGNTFVLRRAMKMSGFDTVVTDLVDQEKLVYGGFSAGSCVAALTLRGLELIDEPDQIPESYTTETVWHGLGLISFSIAPHYRSGHPLSDHVEKVVAYFKDHHLPYKTLKDGEVLVVNGSDITVLP